MTHFCQSGYTFLAPYVEAIELENDDVLLSGLSIF